MTQRNSMIPAILWSQLFDDPQLFNDPKLFDDPQLFDDQLEVWSLKIQKSMVIPSSPMVLFCLGQNYRWTTPRTYLRFINSSANDISGRKWKWAIDAIAVVAVTVAGDRRRLFKDPIKSSGLFRQLLDWAIRREASMKLLCTLHPTPVSPINDKNIPIQDGRLIVQDKYWQTRGQRREIALQKNGIRKLSPKLPRIYSFLIDGSAEWSIKSPNLNPQSSNDLHNL